MIKTKDNELKKFKRILIILFVSNVVLLITYKTYLFPILIKITSAKVDNIDVQYYSKIFNNLHFVIIAFIILITLVLVYYEKIKRYLLNVLLNNNLLIFCIAFNIFFQLLLLIFVTTQPISDSKHHIDNANRLYETRSYINSSGNLTAFWTIGLPAYLVFLKIISSDFITSAKLINILISSGLIIVCYNIFRRYLDLKSLNIFLILFTLFPNNLFSSNVILTDYPFTLLLWSSIFLLLKMKQSSRLIYPILTGILLACASYLRPAGIILPLVFAGILIFYLYPARIRNAFLMLIIFILFLLPWGVRNFNIFHTIVPISTNGGYIFLMGNHEASSGGVNFDFEYNLSNPNEAEESKKAYIKAFNDIINNPIESIVRIPKKLIQTYYRGDSSITWAFKLFEKDIPSVIISAIFYLTNLFFYSIILINILVFFIHRKKINLTKYVELFIITIYIFLILIVYVGSERYHIPLIPIHIFLVAKYFESKSMSIV